MTQWYVKELSKLTKVSVRTLHHYDKIGLLTPSIRLENNYRVYSEADLLKLQQILALKFFGFELKHIKTIMREEINIFDHFQAQQQFLEQQINSLKAASQTLEAILCKSNSNKSVPWKTILKLIEDYQMTKEIKYAWVRKALNPTELKEYASFEQGLTTRFTEEESDAFHQSWLELIKKVEANLDKDPTSNLGIELGERCMDWVNTVFPKEQADLRETLWEKGFKGGHTDVPTEVVTWLDKAVDAYYRERIYSTLALVELQPSDIILKQWNELLEDMYGNVQTPKIQTLKNELYKAIEKDDTISPAAKNWLKKHFK